MDTKPKLVVISDDESYKIESNLSNIFQKIDEKIIASGERKGTDLPIVAHIH